MKKKRPKPGEKKGGGGGGRTEEKEVNKREKGVGIGKKGMRTGNYNMSELFHLHLFSVTFVVWGLHLQQYPLLMFQPHLPRSLHQNFEPL